LNGVNNNPAAALLQVMQPTVATGNKPAPKAGTIPTQALTAGAIASQKKMADAQYAKILADKNEKEKAKVPAVLKKKEASTPNKYYSQFTINK
jgi:hypothetical protein